MKSPLPDQEGSVELPAAAVPGLLGNAVATPAPGVQAHRDL